MAGRCVPYNTTKIPYTTVRMPPATAVSMLPATISTTSRLRIPLKLLVIQISDFCSVLSPSTSYNGPSKSPCAKALEWGAQSALRAERSPLTGAERRTRPIQHEAQ